MALARPREDEATYGLASVPLLRWPAQLAAVRHLEASGLPFLLLIGRSEPPPRSDYRFMDWVRSPCDPDELIVRRSNLEARYMRSREGPRPHLDGETGRLSFGRSTVDLSLSQVAIVQAFLDRYRDVVTAREVCTAFGATPDEGRATIASRIMRLRRRVRLVGLEITLVQGVGYALQPVP
jgi:DNA-binding response OmpR family regulator